MKILYIVGNSLDDNTSSSSFKYTILNELINMQHNITVVQYTEEKFIGLRITKNKNVKIIEGSGYYYLFDRLRTSINSRYKKKITCRKSHWKMVYPEKFIKELCNNLDGEYDLIISLSHPPYAHRIAFDLIKLGNIKYTSWNQIWFEKWFDYFNISSRSDDLIEDEGKLLSFADHIFFSSELLLEDYGIQYSSLKDKMKKFDLPSYPKFFNSSISDDFTVGYFGSYNSKVRNLTPFYEAIVDGNYTGYIIGNSDIEFKEHSYININKNRLLEKDIIELEGSVSVLVVVCNWFADIIPGKIYKYGTWNKPVLVILDGSNRMKKFMTSYFGRYNKFYFAENNKTSIEKALEDIKNNYKNYNYKPIQSFTPESIVKEIIQQI